MNLRRAKYGIGDVVKHRVYPFRGVVFDVDPIFSNTEEWYNSIPQEAYVSEQNLVPDTSEEPVRHAEIEKVFVRNPEGKYLTKSTSMN